MTTKTASGTASAVCLAVNDSNNGQLPVLRKKKAFLWEGFFHQNDGKASNKMI